MLKYLSKICLVENLTHKSQNLGKFYCWYTAVMGDI